MAKGTLLVVDDNPDDQFLLARPLRSAGYRVHLADSADRALEIYADEHVDLCITDHAMPGRDGLELLGALRQRDSTAQVIVVTGHASIDRAVEAMRVGAIDFLTKPVDPTVLLTRIEKALAFDAVLTENRRLRAEVSKQFGFGSLIAESPQMRHLLTLAQQAAEHDVTVLITGESGVGKEVVARAIHHNSARSAGPFFALNCAAIAGNLVESELFGYEKGAFTGADRRKEGLIEQAGRGTLLLDEVGDMPLAAQAKLLRVIENRELIRVGGTRPQQVNTRLIAATNSILYERVQGREFREDLYYRLNVFAIDIPPLRERPEDIPPLSLHFLKRLAKEMGKEPHEFSDDAVEYLHRHDWPGNVRELANAVERALIVCRGRTITAADFPRAPSTPDSSAGAPGFPTPPAEPRSVKDVREAAQDMERSVLEQALEKNGYNLSRAARALGIGRGALRYRLEKLGISPRS